MARKPQSRGVCLFCNEEFGKGGMKKHLQKCPKRIAMIEKEESTEKPSENIWHLYVQDVHQKDYWLELEMKGSATLDSLDSYLRAIWLECCGHLSEFTIGSWTGTKIGKARKASTVFKPGVVLRHLYDFGTTSETNISVVDVRVGKPLTKKPIFLMARNLMPENICQECGQPAGWICVECLEEDKPGGLCEDHLEEHPHDGYGEPIEVINSPRMGMCGYDGPAEPPY